MNSSFQNIEAPGQNLIFFSSTSDPNSSPSPIKTSKEKESTTPVPVFSEDKVQQAVYKLNTMNFGYKFDYNKKIHQFQVDIVNRETGESVKKIPTDEAVEMAERLSQIVRGKPYHY